MIPVPDTLFVFALREEAGQQFENERLLFCGVGKVNSAYALTKALSAWIAQKGKPPAQVINLGSAGSNVFRTGQIVNCTRFVQRDMDARALGCTAFATPFEERPHILKNGQRFPSLPEGICGTGDSFVTNDANSLWNVVDMEAYALAKVCFLENIPFGCLKYITDGANDKAAQAWQEELDRVAQALNQEVRGLFS